MERFLLSVLAITPAIAAADPQTLPSPTPFAITATKQAHRGGTAIAAGQNAWVVAWEDLAPTGDEHRPRTIRAAIVGEAGKIVVAPEPIYSGRSGPTEVFTLWNGQTFTTIVCADHWEGQQHLMWGEMATDGTFAKRGDHVFSQTSVICSAPMLVDNHVEILITDDDTQYGAHDQLLSRRCATRRASLIGDTITLDVAMPLCEVAAANASWAAGKGLKNDFIIADKTGKTVSPTLSYPPNTVVAGASAIYIVAPSNDYKTAERVTFDSAYKSIAHRVPLQATQKYPPGSNPAAIALLDDDLGLFSGNPSSRSLSVFARDGRLKWQVDYGASQMSGSECAASARAILCIWTDDDKTSSEGEVRAVEIKFP